MLITMSQDVHVSPAALAASLAKASPQVFAEFWLEFYIVAKDEKIDLNALGVALAERCGERNNEPLRTIVHAMEAELYRRKMVLAKEPAKLAAAS